MLGVVEDVKIYKSLAWKKTNIYIYINLLIYKFTSHITPEVP